MSTWKRTVLLPKPPEKPASQPPPPAEQAASHQGTHPPATAGVPIGVHDPPSFPIGFYDPAPQSNHAPAVSPGVSNAGTQALRYPAPTTHPAHEALAQATPQQALPNAGPQETPHPPPATWAPTLSYPPVPPQAPANHEQQPAASLSGTWLHIPESAPLPAPVPGLPLGLPGPPIARQPPRRAPARTEVNLGSTATTGISDVREASPAVRVASEPEPLPPDAPRWMHEGRALVHHIEAAIASGHATPYLQMGIERAAWAFQLGGQPAAQVARVCGLIDRVHQVLRGARAEDASALQGDCAALLRSSLSMSQLRGFNPAELPTLIEQLLREPDPRRARRLGAQRLLGWAGVPESWIDAAIDAALAER